MPDRMLLDCHSLYGECLILASKFFATQLNWARMALNWLVNWSRFPFDWKNPVGYLVAVAIQYRVVSVSYRYLSYFLSLAVVFISTSMSIAEDTVSDIRSICENVRIKHQSRSIYKQLAELIDFTNQKRYLRLNLFSQIKRNWSQQFRNIQVTICWNLFRLFRYFIQIYRVTLIALLLGSIGYICIAMLMVQLALVQVIYTSC